MRGNCHDGAGAVAGQHIVGDEDRDLLARDRVGGISTKEDAGLFLVLLALQVGLGGNIGTVGLHGLLRIIVAIGPTLIHVIVIRDGGEEGVDKLMLRGQHHVLGAEEGIRAGGKDLNLVALSREGDLCAAGTANPIALHGLDLVRPIQKLQVIQQAIGVGGNAHHPLREVLAEDREIAALGLTLSGDLLVCQHGTQARAPVHRGIRQVNQTEFIDGRGLFLFGEVLVVAAILSGALIGL